jgi:hypothetical protein
LLSSYFKNCFILLVPILIWNIAFTGLLPATYQSGEFDKDIPASILWGEHILRLVVFALPAFMPLNIFFKYQKIGLGIYFIGIFLYFLSWRPLILYPEGSWSMSLYGFLSPAITPLIFLVGIGLIGHKLFFNIKYHQVVYISLSIIFIAFHTIHVYLKYISLQ